MQSDLQHALDHASLMMVEQTVTSQLSQTLYSAKERISGVALDALSQLNKLPLPESAHSHIATALTRARETKRDARLAKATSTLTKVASKQILKTTATASLALRAAPLMASAAASCSHWTFSKTRDPDQPSFLSKSLKGVQHIGQMALQGVAKAREHLPSFPLPDLSSMPDLPELPSLPSMPDLPDLPDLPELPSLPSMPVLSFSHDKIGARLASLTHRAVAVIGVETIASKAGKVAIDKGVDGAIDGKIETIRKAVKEKTERALTAAQAELEYVIGDDAVESIQAAREVIDHHTTDCFERVCAGAQKVKECIKNGAYFAWQGAVTNCIAPRATHP